MNWVIHRPVAMTSIFKVADGSHVGSAPFVEQLTITKLLGIYMSATLSAAAHVKHILSVANQRMYLLAQLLRDKP